LSCGAVVYAAEEVSKSEVSKSESVMPSSEQGVPLAKIIEDFARRNHKHIVVDPRVRGGIVTYGIDLQKLSYHELETILAVHGYAALTDSDGVISVVPDANVRQSGMPLLTSRSDMGDATVVSKVIPVAHLEAAQLVPILRPLVPQYGHLVAVPG